MVQCGGRPGGLGVVRVRWDTITSCASSVGASVLAKVRSNPRSAPKVPLKNEESRRSSVNKNMCRLWCLWFRLVWDYALLQLDGTFFSYAQS